MAAFPRLFSLSHIKLPPTPFVLGNGSRRDSEAYTLLNEGDVENGGDERGDAQPWTPVRRWTPEKSTFSVRTVVLSVLGVAAAVLMITWLTTKRARGIPVGPPDLGPMGEIDALYARQSSTLAEASARYSLQNNRPPPLNYDKWFQFARDGHCLIDEYHQIYRDFEPFYQLVEKEPGFFKKMVELGIEKANAIKNGNEVKSAEFKGGKFAYTDDHATLYNGEWPKTMDRIAHLIPDTQIILNGRDEPRTLFNVRDPPELDQLYRALEPTDDMPFAHKPSPTSLWFKDEKRCILPNKPTGFTGDANNASAFLINSASTDFTTDFYPILSMTKIIPCFSDILVPSEFYYSDSGWAPKYKYPNNIAWDNKTPKLYWRGASSGGWISNQQDFRHYPRFRLVEIGKNHTDIIDVAITVFQESLCGDGCDGNAIKEEYGITGAGAPREDGYRYKYLVDVDGNSFSGRYFGLLRSGSLVFKSTVFSEYFNDWLQPFKHFIPVLPDMSDLVEKVEWAVKNDAEAHRIQQAGQEFAERVLTDAQNDCYFSLVMLEWATLLRYAEDHHRRMDD